MSEAFRLSETDIVAHVEGWARMRDGSIRATIHYMIGTMHLHTQRVNLSDQRQLRAAAVELAWRASENEGHVWMQLAGLERKLAARAEEAAGARTEEAADQSVAPPWQLTDLLSEEERAAAARETFIDRYARYACQRTDAPVCFHEAMALVMLSVLVGRRAVLRLASGEVYPSLWVLIVADSTLYRKSTAMDLARELVEGVDRELLAPNDFTPQRFVAILAEHDGRPLLFMRDEFSGFYDGLNRLDYMAGFKDDLCSVYDGRPFRRERMKPARIGSGKEVEWRYEVREPFLSMAVATTEERFREVAQTGDVHSGFLARFAVVTPPIEAVERLPIRGLKRAVARERADLREILRRIHRAPTSVRATKQVIARFDEYVRGCEEDARTAPDGNLVGIIGARAAWMGLRCAMLLAVAAGSAEVSREYLLRGLEIAEQWRGNALEVFSGLAPSKFEKRAGRLLQMVQRAGEGGIQRRVVMRSLKANKREMDDMEATLAERGELLVTPVHTAGGKSAVYRLPAKVGAANVGGEEG